MREVSTFPKILAFKGGRLRGEYTGKKTDRDIPEMVKWAGSFEEPIAKEFDGDLSGLPKEPVSFTLKYDGSEEMLKIFEEVAEKHGVDGKV